MAACPQDLGAPVDAAGTESLTSGPHPQWLPWRSWLKCLQAGWMLGLVCVLVSTFVRQWLVGSFLYHIPQTLTS